MFCWLRYKTKFICLQLSSIKFLTCLDGLKCSKTIDEKLNRGLYVWQKPRRVSLKLSVCYKKDETKNSWPNICLKHSQNHEQTIIWNGSLYNALTHDNYTPVHPNITQKRTYNHTSPVITYFHTRYPNKGILYRFMNPWREIIKR